MIQYKSFDSFNKEFTRFQKKHRSLIKDLEDFKDILNQFPEGISNQHKTFHTITKAENCIVKKAKFECKSLKKKLLRIVYGYDKKRETITFIELYSKNDKNNHNDQRVKAYLEDHKQ